MKKVALIVVSLAALVAGAIFLTKYLSDERDEESARPGRELRRQQAETIDRTNELMDDLLREDAAPR